MVYQTNALWALSSDDSRSARRAASVSCKPQSYSLPICLELILLLLFEASRSGLWRGEQGRRRAGGTGGQRNG